MNYYEIISAKIYPNAEALTNTLALWRFKQQKIVFTNGCFDLVHLGHANYLSRAAALGDKLVLGLNTDTSVKRLKGSARPILDENARAFMLASLYCVAAVVLFSEETPYELIKYVQPQVLVKGNDYSAKDIVGYDIVMANGGRVETLDFIDGYSTSGIINKILKE